MASTARVLSQSIRFARKLKLNGSKVNKLTSGLHVSSSTRKLSNTQLAPALASACGFFSGSSKCSLKAKIQFASQPVANVSLAARSAAFLSPASQGSDESSVSTSEGSDSSCEAMEGPHGDDDGLVITNGSATEDL